jgi:hypothetical protein
LHNVETWFVTLKLLFGSVGLAVEGVKGCCRWLFAVWQRLKAFESVWAELHLVTMSVCLALWLLRKALSTCVYMPYTCSTTLPRLLSLVACFTPCPTPAVLPLLHVGFGLEQQHGVDVGM